MRWKGYLAKIRRSRLADYFFLPSFLAGDTAGRGGAADEYLAVARPDPIGLAYGWEIAFSREKVSPSGDVGDFNSIRKRVLAVRAWVL